MSLDLELLFEILLLLLHPLLNGLKFAGMLFENLLLLFTFGFKLCQEFVVLLLQLVLIVKYAAEVRANPLVVFVLCIPEFALQVAI